MLDAFARRHRLRAFEALPWLVALAAYFVFPDYLALGAQILATILFALSLDLVLGYAGIVTWAMPRSSAPAPMRPASWRPMAGASRSAASSPPALAAGAVGFADRRHHPAHHRPHPAHADPRRRRHAPGGSRTRPPPITGGADGLQGMDVWPILGAFRFDLFGRTAYIYCAVVLFLGWLSCARSSIRRSGAP